MNTDTFNIVCCVCQKRLSDWVDGREVSHGYCDVCLAKSLEENDALPLRWALGAAVGRLLTGQKGSW